MVLLAPGAPRLSGEVLRLTIWLIGVTVTLADLMYAQAIVPRWVWVWWVWIALWILVGAGLAVSSAVRAYTSKIRAGGQAARSSQPGRPPATE